MAQIGYRTLAKQQGLGRNTMLRYLKRLGKQAHECTADDIASVARFAVTRRARRKAGKRWTKTERGYLVDIISGTMTVREVAKIVGRTPNAVSIAANRLARGIECRRRPKTGAVGRAFISPHAIRAYRRRIRQCTNEDALADLIDLSQRAHFVRTARDGCELWRAPGPNRIRLIVGPGEGSLPALVTVMPEHDSQASHSKTRASNSPVSVTQKANVPSGHGRRCSSSAGPGFVRDS